MVAIGLNYTAHAAESGATPPEVPVVFLKPTNTIAGPFDAAPIPPSSEKYDWEVELAIVIGREASYLSSVSEAEGCIAGYAVANDLSERDYQIPGAAGQWTKGKSLPGSTPLGPWLVPAADVDAGSLRLQTLVNGEPRQDSNTSDMIFDPATIVHHLSQYMVLEPGDVIITGTPEGVALSGRFPFIQPGDVVELEIEGLGRQRQEYFRAQAGSAPVPRRPSPSPAPTPEPAMAPAVGNEFDGLDSTRDRRCLRNRGSHRGPPRRRGCTGGGLGPRARNQPALRRAVQRSRRRLGACRRRACSARSSAAWTS